MAKVQTRAKRGTALSTGTAVATVANDITIANYSDVLHPLDDTLLERGGGEGLKIYDAIERDTHAWAVLQKRKHKLVGREWIVEPGGEAKADIEAADFIRDQLNTLPFDQICLDLLDATLKGFAVCEAVYAKDGRHVRAEALTSLEQRRFVFDTKWKPRLLTLSAPLKGEQLPERKFVVHRFGVKGNNPYGLGMGTRLFWPVLFKRNGVAYWMKFLERFASPIPIGKYPEGASQEQQANLQRVLEMMNHASAIRVPLGTELDKFESGRSGSSDYGNWGKFWNAEISKSVLGETLTTEMGETGARAASETHQDILDALVDSDGDLLAGTLNTGLIRWLCAFNYPHAAVPRVWWPRPSNELQQEELMIKRAERRRSELDTLAAMQEAGYEPEDMGAYMEGVFGFPVKSTGTAAQKKSPAEPAFADPGGIGLTEILAAVEAVAAPVHMRWVAELREIAHAAADENALSAALLEWQGREASPGYTGLLGDALALAELVGRGEVIDEDGSPELAEPATGTVRFTEAHEFMRQKVSLPTAAWTDTLHQAHDRAFAVAGADSVSLVEDIRQAMTRAMDGGGGLEAFRKSFDEIVERTGWQYNGGRNWRTRVIYETNLRTMHQAGRLRQMRHPDVVKARPYWQYVHAETREPKQPREEHLAWDRKVFRHDDPIWEKIYPPNGWKCSCGVRTLSAAGLRRLGKTAPDEAPELKMRRHRDPATGEWTEVPEGIDFGWGYQPGDTWERGLVPRELQRPLSLAEPELPLPAAPPLDELGRPFTSPQLPAGKDPEYYVSRFLERFGARIGQGVMFRDKAGQAVLISDQLFRTGSGAWKVTKFGREVDIERLAEAIFDPDEIWLDWVDVPGQHRRLVRRYMRWHPETGAYSSFTWTPRFWQGLTAFSPRKRGGKGKPDQKYLEKHRRGVLIFRRENT
ncbi:phage portal protein family protein [Roseobacteraceae bacterium NS-SX3]